MPPIFAEIWRGKDLYRILMNQACLSETVRGSAIDVGSGLNSASYHRFLQRAPGATVHPLDLHFQKNAGGTVIDLESGRLPMNDLSADTVLLFNVLEHLYNYSHVLQEISRVLRFGGSVVGAVPFLVGYHPDPRDYWRYTRETLEKIFASAGFREIKIQAIVTGPFGAAWSQIEAVFPRFMKLALAPITLGLDRLVRAMRPKLSLDKWALGFFFVLKK